MTLSRNGFQNFVNRQPPPAIVGGYASMNPRASALAGEGAFRSTAALDYASAVANPIVGNFAWGQGLFASRQRQAGAAAIGFVAHELQTVIPFLAPNAGNNPTRLAIETGFPVTLQQRGDFWTIAQGLVAGIISAGDTVYARQYDGAATNDSTAFSATGVQTAASSTLTVSAVTKGFLSVGMVITGAGVAANTSIVAQLTGTPGGAGTYTVSNTTGFASATITVAAEDTGFKFQSAVVADAVTNGATTIAAATGIMTVAAVASGVIEQGQNVSGTGVPNNLFIVSQLTGTPGGAGTYQLNYSGPAVAAFTATLTQGKLVKISRAA